MLMKNKKSIIGAVVLVIVVAVLFGVYTFTKPQTKAGSKDITVQVVDKDGKTEDFEYHTDRQYLGEVLQDEKLVEGENGEYGLFITSVNGIKADASNQEWWCITKGGEYLNTSADKTPVEDGDAYELTLTVGY